MRTLASIPTRSLERDYADATLRLADDSREEETYRRPYRREEPVLSPIDHAEKAAHYRQRAATCLASADEAESKGYPSGPGFRSDAAYFTRLAEHHESHAPVTTTRQEIHA